MPVSVASSKTLTVELHDDPHKLWVITPDGRRTSIRVNYQTGESLRDVLCFLNADKDANKATGLATAKPNEPGHSYTVNALGVPADFPITRIPPVGNKIQTLETPKRLRELDL